MTLICDYCKKPLKPTDNKSITLGETTLDFHEECRPKWIDRIVNGTLPPPPSPPPAPAPAVAYAPPNPKPRKEGFWSGRRRKEEPVKEMTDEELAGAFG